MHELDIEYCNWIYDPYQTIKNSPIVHRYDWNMGKFLMVFRDEWKCELHTMTGYNVYKIEGYSPSLVVISPTKTVV